MIDKRKIESIWYTVTEKNDCRKVLNKIKVYSKELYIHSLQVGVVSTILGCFYKLNVYDIFLSGLFHDYGKIQIPKDILEKPGQLSLEEKKIMNIHPVLGYTELKKTTSLSKEILYGVLDHHERVDGTGYAFGKKEKEISQFGKIISVADVYCAMMDKRVYRSWCFSQSEVLREIYRSVEHAFDKDIVRKLNIMSEYVQDVISDDFLSNLEIEKCFVS